MRAPAPVCLVAPDQVPSALFNVAEVPQVVVDGRGDKRTTKGKRKAKSFGKVWRTLTPAPHVAF
jgi:hypothetical protein